MAPLKQKGDLAELKVAADLVGRGYRIAWPQGEDCDFDLVLCREDRLERVQVKYAESDGHVIVVRCKTQSLTNGRVIAVKHYTAALIDWLAVYDHTTECCYYIPASLLGSGMWMMHLRLTPALSGRRRGIHWAADYMDLEHPAQAA